MTGPTPSGLSQDGQPSSEVVHKLRINGPDQYGYFRAKCRCGWPGSPWAMRREARAEYDRHITEEHDDDRP